MVKRSLAQSGMGKEKRRELAVPTTHRFGRRNSVSDMYSNGTAIVKVDTGPYTYQYFQMSLISNAEIVGETIEKAGVHFVKTAFLSKYMKTVTLEIDGTPERDQEMTDLVTLNAWQGFDATDGFVFMTFGGPHEFTDAGAEDAYMLGTSNLRTVRLLYDLTDSWVEGSMQIKVIQEYAPVAKNLAYIQTTKTYRSTFTTIGENSILDLPANADIARIFVFGSGIKNAELVIDDQSVFNAHSYEIQAMNGLFGANIGRDVAALGDCIVFDFWRDQEYQKAIRGLRTGAQQRRNASIALNLETLIADTEVRVVVDICGRYASQG